MASVGADWVRLDSSWSAVMRLLDAPSNRYSAFNETAITNAEAVAERQQLAPDEQEEQVLEEVAAAELQEPSRPGSPPEEPDQPGLRQQERMAAAATEQVTAAREVCATQLSSAHCGVAWGLLTGYLCAKVGLGLEARARARARARCHIISERICM
jgi:hypothetical protein